MYCMYVRMCLNILFCDSYICCMYVYTHICIHMYVIDYVLMSECVYCMYRRKSRNKREEAHKVQAEPEVPLIKKWYVRMQCVQECT